MTTVPSTATTVPSIKTTQLFSRAAIGSLWARRAEFDDATRKQIDRLYNNRKKGSLQAQQEIVYSLPHTKTGALGFGRLYSVGPGLEKLQNECRATLCCDLYHDIDIVNAQPSLLVQLAKRDLELDMPELETYNENRDLLIAHIMEANSLPRDSAKQEILSILFGGSTKDPMLSALYNEVRAVAKHFSRLPKYTELFESKKSEKNIYGSFLASLTQTAERDAMLAMRDTLLTAGWSVDVLAYDGLMVRKRTDATCDGALMEAIAANIKAVTGFDVQVKEKPMVGFEDLLEHVVDAEDEPEYLKMKANFELEHSYFKPTNTIMNISQRCGITHMSIDHAMIALNTMRLPTKSKKDEPELFIKRWIKDPKRRIVNAIVYKMPADCEPDEASLFTGFAYKEMDGHCAADLDLFKDIMMNCCADSTDVYDYLIRYFAHIIQKPFEKPGTAIILTSATHGTGKDTLINIIGRVIGRHSQHYSSTTTFWDKHDTGKEGALMLHLEESEGNINKAKSSELKALITADSVNTNPKGVKLYSVPNVSRIIMTSNNTDVVKLEQSDRRFVIIRPANRLYKKGLDWWGSIQTQIHSETFLHTVGCYLETLDLTGWNPRVIPTTELKADLMELSKSPEQEFLEALSHDADSTSPWLRAVDIYALYKSWYGTQEMDPRFMAISAASLGKKLLDWQGKYYVKRRNNYGIMYRVLPESEVIA